MKRNEKPTVIQVAALLLMVAGALTLICVPSLSPRAGRWIMVAIVGLPGVSVLAARLGRRA
jgi:hypothetical protein